jgi:hypothetical protein
LYLLLLFNLGYVLRATATKRGFRDDFDFRPTSGRFVSRRFPKTRS